MKPMISTLTPCYRGDKYLPTFLEQVPNQTAFDRLEIVIDLNAPSKDELRCVSEFQERYPGHLKYMVRDKVVTYSASWNNCIRAASGEYLAIWNIDDLRTPVSIEAQANYLDENPEIGLVHGKYKVVREFGSTEGRPYRDNEKNTEAPVSDASRRFLFGPFYMFRKSLIEKAGYVDEQFRSSADFDHTIRLALNTKFAAVAEYLGYYLNAGLGLSSRSDSPIDIENFVIRMRYGIYDKMWYHYLAASSDYDYYKILNGNEWLPVKNFVQDYRKMLEERYKMYFDVGYIHHIGFKSKEKMFGLDGIMQLMKKG